MSNDNEPVPAWACIDCEFAGPGASLCRRLDGSHSFDVLARAYLSDGTSDDDEASALRHRAFDCVAVLVEAAPDAAVGFLVVATAECLAVPQLCVIAAGPLEDLLCAHGPAVIGQLEKIAKADPRFRLMLSGTWGQERIDPDVWARLAKSVTPGPVLDKDGRTPGAGTGAPVVTDADCAALFAPRGCRQAPATLH